MLPFALEAAVCALCVDQPGMAMPGVATPALGLPLPSPGDTVKSISKTLVVVGGSASTGSMVTQMATAAGINVIAITGAKNADLVKQCGASVVLDRHDESLVDNIVDAFNATGTTEFVGIFDAISSSETYAQDLAILAKLGGGHLACTHPPPADVPANVQAGMIFAVNDVAAPVWKEFVTPALRSGQLKCLPPPMVVGKGLQYIDKALKIVKAGVSGTKVVVEL